MPSRTWRILLYGLSLLIAFQAGLRGIYAQTAYTAILSAPDTSEFPHLRATLDVHDSSGAFVHGLSAQDVTMQENEIQVPVGELQEQKTGVQFIIAVSPGESFIIRDGLGVSRFEYLLQGLLSGTWADQLSGMDDFSLLTLGGPQVVHSPNPALIHSSLESYQPGDLESVPSLEALSAALQVIAAPTARPGMERAVLFITSPQPSEASLGLQSIITSASQQNIRIYVWLVGATEVFDLPDTDMLRNLAEQTHASFFAFSGTEPVPDLEAILEPLRYVYQLGYESQVSTAGPQIVAAQVMLGSDVLTTGAQSFEVNLQAPALALASLPGEIVRLFPTSSTPGVANNGADLTPLQQLVQIQVSFPDGHERSLTRTSLFVDGMLYAENTSSPFDRFTWDLGAYTQDGEHTLRVEAVDDFGLTGSTGETSVRITVPTPTQNFVVMFSQKRLLLVGVVVSISASVLILVLILAGRIHPRPHPGQVVNPAGYSEKTKPKGYLARMRQLKDPVTQPVKIAALSTSQTVSRSIRWRDRLPWLKRKETPLPAIAYLLPLVNADEPTLPAPMQINTDDVTLGRNPQQATLVIADPSLEELHARIHHEGDQFLITDAGSVAGTWVNYLQVPPSGTPLEHADIIHLGGVGFRFNLAQPGPVRKMVITPVEPDQ